MRCCTGMESNLDMMKWQSQFLTTVAQSISSRKHLSRSIRSCLWIFMMPVKQSISPSISSSQYSLQAMTVATHSTHALSSNFTLLRALRQQRVKMQRERVIRKGCGVSQINSIVSRLISRCGTSMERMVRTTVSERRSSLNISSLEEEEKSSSLMRMEIFLLLPRVARASQCSRAPSALGTASASKQMREPNVIFLKDNIFSFFFQLESRSEDLAYLLMRYWTSVHNLRLLRNSRRNPSTFSNRSFSACLFRSIFWLCV